jgi:hypothetical protein
MPMLLVVLLVMSRSLRWSSRPLAASGVRMALALAWPHLKLDFNGCDDATITRARGQACVQKSANTQKKRKKQHSIA